MRSNSDVLVSFTGADERGYYDQPPMSHRSDRRCVKRVWNVQMPWPSFKNGEKGTWVVHTSSDWIEV